jgi:hypothetical protein
MRYRTLTLVAVAGIVAQATDSFYVTPELIAETRSKATTWTPYDYELHPFKDEDMLKRTGLITTSPGSS